MYWFSVALCLRWPPPTSSYFPEYIGTVEACSAFAAITLLMRSQKLAYVAYADAFAGDGSLHYRCHKLLLGEDVVIEAKECDGHSEKGRSVTR